MRMKKFLLYPFMNNLKTFSRKLFFAVLCCNFIFSGTLPIFRISSFYYFPHRKNFFLNITAAVNVLLRTLLYFSRLQFFATKFFLARSESNFALISFKLFLA